VTGYNESLIEVD